MRLFVDISPSGRTLTPGRTSTRQRKGKTPPCVSPWCKNPLGGRGHSRSPKGTPVRIHGMCVACYEAYRRAARTFKPAKVERCADPKCRAPRGGLPKVKGGKPARINGYCRTCWNRHAARYRRRTKGPDASRKTP